MRYYFDLIGTSVHKDHVGMGYESDTAACQEARLRALDESYQLQTYKQFHSISVRDETNRVVLSVAIRR